MARRYTHEKDGSNIAEHCQPEILMLDALRNMTGGNGKVVQQYTSELEMLVATAREERTPLSAMLTTLTAHGAKLLPIGKSLEQVTDKTTSLMTRLDEIGNRLAALDERTKEL